MYIIWNERDFCWNNSSSGLITYLGNRFSAEKDVNLINTIIVNQDNRELIIRLLESRFPQEREQTRLF